MYCTDDEFERVRMWADLHALQDTHIIPAT